MNKRNINKALSSTDPLAIIKISTLYIKYQVLTIDPIGI